MDYSGFVFGDIKVLKRADGDLERVRNSLKEKGRTQSPKYECKCLLCGKIFVADIYSIKNRKNKNCGCEKMKYNLKGKRFGSLTAINPLCKNAHGEMIWECLCDCGTICQKTSYALRHNDKISCPNCRNKKISEKNRKYIIENKRIKEAYVNMKTRCYNPKSLSYKTYGARGITVCDEWKKSYSAFQAWALSNGYSDDLTIDRINNDGNYEPSNCRWVSRTEQCNNRTSSRYLFLKEEKDTLANWSRRLKIPYAFIQYRADRGKDLEQIIYEWENRANTRHS